MVHVQEFLQQTQNQEEGVPNFLTRLRGVAAPFEFRERCQDCAWDVSYSDTIVWFKLITGLYNAEIKEDILSLEEKSLDNTVKALLWLTHPPSQISLSLWCCVEFWTRVMQGYIFYNLLFWKIGLDFSPDFSLQAVMYF